MTREAVVERIRGIFSECLALSEVSETTHLFEDLKLDSIQQMTLIVELENRFRIRLDEDDASGIATVGDVADLVVERLGAGVEDEGAPS